MGDERDLGSAPQRQPQAMDAQDHAPAENAQQNGQPPANERQHQSGRVNQRQGVPKLRGSRRPRRLKSLPARERLPGMPLPLPGQPPFVQENRVQNPEHQQRAAPQPPADPPDFPPGAHSSPQKLFKCATPLFKSSAATPGLSSNTLMCSGLTAGLSEPKSIVP